MGIWKDDKLGRKSEAQLIRQFVLGQLQLRRNAVLPQTYVLNLNSNWGGGKTFFLERFKQQLEKDGHVCVYVNAWEDDHQNNPFIAVVSSIKKELEKHLPKELPANLKNSLSGIKENAGRIAFSLGKSSLFHVLKKAVGEDGLHKALLEVSEEGLGIVGESLLEGFEKDKNSVVEFRDSLAAMLDGAKEHSGISLPVFVLIDELDRCRPSYAIELLEKVKHLFSVENLVFVVATDSDQLSKAVAGVYGSSFDGARYFKRFFDRVYEFDQVPRAKFIEHTMARLGLKGEMFCWPMDNDDPLIDFLTTTLDLPDVQLRDIEQIFALIETFVSIWPHENLKINMGVLLPFAYELHALGKADWVGKSDIRGKIISWVSYNDNGQAVENQDTVGEFMQWFFDDGQNLFSRDSIARYGLLRWVNDSLNEEMRVLHNNSYRRGQNVPSVVLEYPDLLRKVGRLHN